MVTLIRWLGWRLELKTSLFLCLLFIILHFIKQFIWQVIIKEYTLFTLFNNLRIMNKGKDISQLRKDFLWNIKRRTLLIETIKDLKREWLLYKDIAKALKTDTGNLSRIISWETIPSANRVNKLLSYLKL